MTDHLTYLLLGLGSGSVIAALAIGVVITYRASNVINLGHAAIGMYVAFAYYELRRSGDLVLAGAGAARSRGAGRSPHRGHRAGHQRRAGRGGGGRRLPADLPAAPFGPTTGPRGGQPRVDGVPDRCRRPPLRGAGRHVASPGGSAVVPPGRGPGPSRAGRPLRAGRADARGHRRAVGRRPVDALRPGHARCRRERARRRAARPVADDHRPHQLDPRLGARRAGPDRGRAPVGPRPGRHEPADRACSRRGAGRWLPLDRGRRAGRPGDRHAPVRDPQPAGQQHAGSRRSVCSRGSRS